jgi:hypothetical protein
MPIKFLLSCIEFSKIFPLLWLQVEPYLDIANLYKQVLQLTSVDVKRQGRRFVAGGTYSLTGISKAVLGVGLCKV